LWGEYDLIQAINLEAAKFISPLGVEKAHIIHSLPSEWPLSAFVFFLWRD
jgi:hypothetical protein